MSRRIGLFQAASQGKLLAKRFAKNFAPQLLPKRTLRAYLTASALRRLLSGIDPVFVVRQPSHLLHATHQNFLILQSSG